MNQSHAPFSHLIRSPEGSDGAGAAPKSAAKKSAPMSRLGRGLGALIPAAAPRSSPVTPPPSPSTSPANAPVGGDASSNPPGATKAQSITSTSAAPSASAYRDPTGVGVQAPQAVTAEPKMASSASGASTAPKGSNSPSPRAGTPTTESVEARATDLPAGDGSSGVPSQGVATSPKSSPTAAAAAASAAERSTWNTTSDQSVINIPIARIQRNPRQPREKFDDAALRALAESIRQDGLLQPIVVRASRVISPTNGVQMYELIAGERRLRAFTLLGRSAIPALVQKVDDRTSAVLALIENVQREDLNPMERAHGLQKLMHEFSFSQQDLATRVGLDRSTVANLLRLNDLDTHTASALREGAITTGHAKALLGLSDVVTRKSLVARIVSEGMSVRELESAVRHASAAGSPPNSSGRLPSSGRVISAQVADLERRIGAHLGTEVSLKTGRKAGSGSITIKFGSHGQFEGLMERIGFDLEGSDRPRGR
jgi:ParB family chromosome partitioning protein